MPAFEGMPMDATEKEIEEVLKVPFMAWNAVVLDEVNGNKHWSGLVQAQLSSYPEGLAKVNQLMRRKRTEFADEKHLIGAYRVTRKGGNLNLWAEAREARKST